MNGRSVQWCATGFRDGQSRPNPLPFVGYLMAPHLFSRLYINETSDKHDDPRMRKRLGTQAQSLANTWANVTERFRTLVEGELGAAMSRGFPGSVIIGEFFATTDARDVLDGITVFGLALRGSATAEVVRAWYASIHASRPGAVCGTPLVASISARSSLSSSAATTGRKSASMRHYRATSASSSDTGK